MLGRAWGLVRVLRGTAGLRRPDPAIDRAPHRAVLLLQHDLAQRQRPLRPSPAKPEGKARILAGSAERAGYADPHSPAGRADADATAGTHPKVLAGFLSGAGVAHEMSHNLGLTSGFEWGCGEFAPLFFSG